MKEVIRQNEPDLIQAINEFCDGEPSAETVELMKNLSRPLSAIQQAKATYIFGTNFDVNFYNYDQLMKLPGEIKVFEAKDKGAKKYFHTCNAPKLLAVKQNCKVLVVRNLPNGLVNGLTGTVLKISDSTIQIRIDADDNLKHRFGGKIFDIDQYSFIV